jgi:methionyl-tRNA formyltransferase
MISNHHIVFMGSPDFALSTLQALHENYPVVGVVTQPDRAAGRGRELKPPPVKKLALELGIPVIQPEKLREPEAMEQLHSWSPDVIVVAAFGQILKQDVLDLPEFGCINVHASLLPRWRGAAPINAAILHGDEETGITIMKMDAGLDTGPILSQRSVRIKPDETAGSLFKTLSQLGADLLLKTLPGYISGEIVPHPQPEGGATYAGMMKKQEGELDFSQPAAELERKVRAFNPWPGTYFDWDGGRLKVHKAHTTFVFTYMFQPPGTRTTHDGLPSIYGGDNTMLVLEEVQPAGKKRMSGKAFLAGARNWVK